MNAQSKFSFNPGLYYNGTFFDDDAKGMGLILGLEYMPSKDHMFSIELRTRYGYYTFDDGTKWSEDRDGNIVPPKNPSEARLNYNLFSPQVGIVPKIHLYFDESLSFFLENEIAIGLMTGSFKFKGFDEKKRFTEATFCNNIGIGASYKFKKWTLSGSIAYSTLNFRDNIKDHRPTGHPDWIPNQDVPILINILFKIPLYF